MSDWVETVVGMEVPHVETHSRDKGTWLTEYTEEEAEKEFPNIAKYSTSTDLISRADAIELCADAQGRASTKSELKGISKVWQGLLKLPSAEDEWTPVSEGLPEAEYGEGDCVLTTCCWKTDKKTRWVEKLYFNGGNWCYPTGECFTHKVIAWKPLPKPYREGGKA